MKQYKNSKAKEIKKMLEKKMTVLEIAIKLKISPQAVYKYIKRHNLRNI